MIPEDVIERMGLCSPHLPSAAMTLRLSLLLALLVGLLAADAADAQITRSAVRSGTPMMAQSQTSVEDMGHGNRTTGRISGTNLSGGVDLLVPDGGGVYGVELGERSDQPCHLVLKWATIDNDEMSLAETPFSNCYGEPTSRSVTAVGMAYADTRDEWVLGGWELLYTGTFHASIAANAIAQAFDNSVPRNPRPIVDGQLVGLKGLKVCQKNSNDEMKGLAVRGVSLLPTSTRFNTRPLRHSNGSWIEESFARPHCNDWDDMEVCGNGEVMVGVRVESERSNGVRAKSKIKGLAPICARLEIES